MGLTYSPRVCMGSLNVITFPATADELGAEFCFGSRFKRKFLLKSNCAVTQWQCRLAAAPLAPLPDCCRGSSQRVGPITFQISPPSLCSWTKAMTQEKRLKIT